MLSAVYCSSIESTCSIFVGAQCPVLYFSSIDSTCGILDGTVFNPVYYSSIESTCCVFGSTKCSVVCIVVALRVPVVNMAVHSVQSCVL